MINLIRGIDTLTYNKYMKCGKINDSLSWNKALCECEFGEKWKDMTRGK